jgi:DNA invertase Pin-like site-specific DNA recombinase
MIKRVALYGRISTDTKNQTVENQLGELRAVGARLGWIVVAIYTDEGVSGAKGRDKRPGYDALLRAIGRKEFDLIMTVMLWPIHVVIMAAMVARLLTKR